MMLFNKLKNHFIEVLLIILLINLTNCHVQEAVTTAPATQTHWQRPVQATRNTVTRWKANQTPASTSTSTSQNCDYKELITNLHDRVSLLATVDEDLRKRLDSIEKKIVQFEASNLARLDSLGVQQMDFSKRIDVAEHIQRLTRHGIDQLIGEFGEYMKLLNHTQITDNRNYTNDNTDNVDLNVLRKSRQANQRTQQQPQAQLPQGVFSVSDSQKLDALATLLTSTRVAINALQAQLQTNVTKLMQTTGNLQRRFNNLYRKQQNQGAFNALAPNFYATANTAQQLTTSCAQGILATNGILKLQLTPTSDPFYVACDDELLGGGWTIIMNRFNGDINFQRGWLEYKHGFGNLAGEFFMGLDKLYALTASSVHELLITLEDFENKRKYARYNLFAIGNEQESYELKLLGKYEGDAGDSFSYHAGSKFSTFDNDNDGCVDCNCAQSHKGAWWYNWCDQSNLMGPYYDKDYDKIEQYRADWKDAASLDYASSRRSVGKVGLFLAKLLEQFLNKFEIPLSEVHIIGHSLGAHIAGNMGRYFNGSIGRVTGLDPALPLFSSNGADGLHSNAGVFVDVIHTDYPVFGDITPRGRVDFYPNYGEVPQKGCDAVNIVAAAKLIFESYSCSHNRAVILYAESIGMPQNFPSIPCSLGAIKKRSANLCLQEIRNGGVSKTSLAEAIAAKTDDVIAYMGEGVSKSASGFYYLETYDVPPFGMGLYTKF